MTKVHEAEVVEAIPEEALEAGHAPEPKADLEVLLRTCSGCNKEFHFALAVVFGKPYCGGCLLKVGRQAKSLIGSILDGIFPKQRKKDSK